MHRGTIILQLWLWPQFVTQRFCNRFKDTADDIISIAGAGMTLTHVLKLPPDSDVINKNDAEALISISAFTGVTYGNDDIHGVMTAGQTGSVKCECVGAAGARHYGWESKGQERLHAPHQSQPPCKANKMG